MSVMEHGLPPAAYAIDRRPPAPHASPFAHVSGVGARPRHLRDWLAVLVRYRLMVATIVGGCVALALLATLLTPREYTAGARLEVSHRNPIQLRLQDNVLRVEDRELDRDAVFTFLATQLAVLRSRDLAERVLRERGLEDGTVLRRPAPDQAAVGELADFLQPRGLAAGTTHATHDDTAPLDSRVIDRYLTALSVRDVRGTDLVDVAFTTRSPTLSAFLAAAHTQAYIEANQQARQRTDVLARQFLDKQVAEAQDRLVTAEGALGHFAADHPRIAANQEQKLDGQRIAELSKLLTKTETERLGLESRYEFVTRHETQSLPYFLDEPEVQKLRLALSDVETRRAGLQKRLGPNHPEMLDLAQLAAEIRRQLDAEIRQQVAAVEARYDAIRAREGRLRRRLARDERDAGRLRELGARWELLKGDVDTSRALHQSLLKQRMDTAVNAELVASNVRVIDRPEVPHRPSRPNAPLNLAIGLTAGLVFGIGAAFARDHLDDSVKGHGDIEELLQTPTLATIPNFDETAPRPALGMATVRALVARGRGVPADAAAPPTPPRTELVVMRAPWSGVAEAFRSMRTAVLFAAPDDPPRVALVTSARPAEGKTVASLNLALVLAQSGARVVLVDADLRHPRAHAALGASNAAGLANVLLGEATLADVAQPVADLPLVLVPAGPPPPNPSELVGSARMRAALATLRETYDFVVIDTPPVLAVTDAVVLAREADGVILVVKGDETPRELVRRARDRLVAAGGRLLGVVVNNVRPGWSDPYGGYGQYGYPAPGAGGRTPRSDVASGRRA